jgi:hypothetical protein
MKNQKAIVVYLDNNDTCEEEFTWLYKTWLLYSLENEYDLVVYHHPDAINRANKFVGIVKIEMPPIRLSRVYKFLNSHYFCLDEWSEPLKKYKYILKTDCDVFLTENIKGYTPYKFCVGQGGYYQQTETEKFDYIRSLSKRLNLQHNNMSLIGASFYGKADEVIEIVKNQANITEFIISEIIKEDEFKKVGFHGGIASMIAGEIVINFAFSNQHVNLYTLDTKCWESTKIGGDVIHIHAWHSYGEWSKHQYFKGEYKDWEVTFEDAFKNAANYCQWIANLSYSDLFYYKEKYTKGELKIDYDL